MSIAHSTEARKHDVGKVPLSWIPRTALVAEAEVMAFGASKYGRHNWRGGLEWSRLIDATLRHLTAFNEGEDIDPESGLSHLAHARCSLAFLIEYTVTHPELDDRHGSQAGKSISLRNSQVLSEADSPREDEQPVLERHG